MEPALRDGDGLIAVRSRRARAGQRRLFEHPHRPGTWLVKRVDAVRADATMWVLSDNADVTGRFDVAIDGVTAQWINRAEAEFLMEVTAADKGSHREPHWSSEPVFGSLVFRGNMDNKTKTVLPEGGRIRIPGGADTIELHVPNAVNDHFGVRGVSLVVSARER